MDEQWAKINSTCEGLVSALRRCEGNTLNPIRTLGLEGSPLGFPHDDFYF